MKYALLAFAILVGGCQFKTPSNPDEQPALPYGKDWPEDAKSLLTCMNKHSRFSKCVEMGPQRRMRGVWFSGFEEGGFIPDVDTVPLVRSLGSPEFKTVLEIDDEAAARKLALPKFERCPIAVAIEFFGRRGDIPGPKNGIDEQVVVVDRLLGGRLIGRIQSRGVPGYDEQCATPAPTPAEVEAMDKADWEHCRERGQCITPEELEKIAKPRH